MYANFKFQTLESSSRKSNTEERINRQQPFYFSVNFGCSQNWLHSKWNRIRQDRPKDAAKRKMKRKKHAKRILSLIVAYKKCRKLVFRRLLHNILCLILMNVRDCAKKQKPKRKKSTQLNDVYIWNSISQANSWERTNIFVPALVPLSSCLSRVRFVRNIPFTVTSKTCIHRQKKKMNWNEHFVSPIQRPFCVYAIDMCQPPNKPTK